MNAAKRFMNALTVLAVIWVFIAIGIVLPGPIYARVVYAAMASCLAPLFGIALVNYVAYGKFTLWHKD